MSKELKKSSFDPHLNDTFEVNADALGPVKAELVDVKDHSRENLESFSLLFKVSKDTFFDQKLYKVNHPKMGDIDLFLVPVVHEDQDAFYYESAFTRLIEKSSDSGKKKTTKKGGKK